jgi:hypothetical protein
MISMPNIMFYNFTSLRNYIHSTTTEDRIARASSFTRCIYLHEIIAAPITACHLQVVLAFEAPSDIGGQRCFYQ